MPKINLAGSGHGNFTSPAGNRYWEYSDPAILTILTNACLLIVSRSVGHPACNDCFKKLRKGRSFDEVFGDGSVWVNYEPRADRGWYGITYNKKEISISKAAFDKGAEWVAGTLVHELAHVNGAPGTTADADATLIPCDFKAAYEGVVGQKDKASDSRMG